MKSAESRCHNTGLINLSKKDDENKNYTSGRISHGESVRKMAKDYQKQLQTRYNHLRINHVRCEKSTRINHERDIKHWYEQRTKGLK